MDNKIFTDVVGYLCLALSIIGSIFNIYKKSKCFVFFILSNICLVYVSYMNSQLYNILLAAFYTVMNVFGLYKWGNK